MRFAGAFEVRINCRTCAAGPGIHDGQEGASSQRHNDPTSSTLLLKPHVPNYCLPVARPPHPATSDSVCSAQRVKKEDNPVCEMEEGDEAAAPEYDAQEKEQIEATAATVFPPSGCSS